MIPKLYRVSTQLDASRVAYEISARLRVAGPCEVYVTQFGEGDERSRWQRRYRKLCELLSEEVAVDGVKYSPRVWSVSLKERFLLPEEIRLPGGRIYQQLPSTRDMPREARDSYLEQCQEFAAENGVFLQNPDTETV